MPDFQIIIGDALTTLQAMPSESVDCCITSPPYWGLRDYGHAGQMGLEPTPAEYVAAMGALFREVGRVLVPHGTLWLNLGDSYASNGRSEYDADPKLPQRGGAQRRRSTTVNGLKPKDMVGIPWRVAFALQDDGWYLRSDIIWAKPNPMPEPVTDRPTKSHEYLFLLSKSPRYFYDSEAIKEPGMAMNEHDATGQGYHAPGQAPHTGSRGIDKQRGHSRRHAGFNERWDAMSVKEQCSVMRNKRDVWTIPPEPFKGAHFAVMPSGLVAPCVLAGCPEGGLVLDPFTGSGTVGVVSLSHGRRFLGIELNPVYAAMAERRINASIPGPRLFPITNQASA